MKKLTGLMVAMALGAAVALLVACGSSGSSKADAAAGGPDAASHPDGGTTDAGHDAN